MPCGTTAGRPQRDISLFLLLVLWREGSLYLTEYDCIVFLYMYT